MNLPSCVEYFGEAAFGRLLLSRWAARSIMSSTSPRSIQLNVHLKVQGEKWQIKK